MQTAITGESLTEVVVNSLRERLAHEQRRPAPRSASEILREARARLSRLPVKDSRPPDEIIGYDDWGLPR